MSTKAIEVRIWNQTVGAVAADPASGAYAFEYDPAWRRRGVELAPLMMPLSSRTSIFTFPSLGDSFKRLPGLLSDALPDDFGNALIDAWMAQHGVAKAAVTALDRLAYMGRRGMGALEFRPSKGTQRESRAPLEMQHLVEAARTAVRGGLDGDAEAKAAFANIIKVGTSAGGARAKAVIAWNPTTDEIRCGQFDVQDGFEHWLVKFDGVGKDTELGTSSDYGRIEYAYHLMAKQAGIDMSECRLLRENGRAHFATRRFDRRGNEKMHMQTLCALAHLDFKQRATHAYEQLFLAIGQLALGDAAKAQAFRRMTFNVVARNCDDHSKNFGFLMALGGPWQLAPAYDVTHAYNPTGEWTYQHLMSVNGKFDGITRQDLLQIADRFLVPAADRLVDEVQAALSLWPQFAEKAELPQTTSERVRGDFLSL
jgi:serine/threonine-protein kinase HipA